MSAEIVTSQRTVERKVEMTLHLTANPVEAITMNVGRLIPIESKIEREVEIDLFIDPEVV